MHVFKKTFSLRGLNIPNKKRAMAQNIYILTAMFIVSTIFCIAGDYILGTKTYDNYLRYEFIILHWSIFHKLHSICLLYN